LPFNQGIKPLQLDVKLPILKEHLHIIDFNRHWFEPTGMKVICTHKVNRIIRKINDRYDPLNMQHHFLTHLVNDVVVHTEGPACEVLLALLDAEARGEQES